MKFSDFQKSQENFVNHVSHSDETNILRKRENHHNSAVFCNIQMEIFGNSFFKFPKINTRGIASETNTQKTIQNGRSNEVCAVKLKK